ncbi:hypothetical protein B0H14DRAFT_3492436 [Mycena olivaceomarginata]|nr:hypothetical protein B0H14DRAFT_3492436 [Mycena olivaceomarginata]
MVGKTAGHAVTQPASAPCSLNSVLGSVKPVPRTSDNVPPRSAASQAPALLPIHLPNTLFFDIQRRRALAALILELGFGSDSGPDSSTPRCNPFVLRKRRTAAQEHRTPPANHPLSSGTIENALIMPTIRTAALEREIDDLLMNRKRYLERAG